MWDLPPECLWEGIGEMLTNKALEANERSLVVPSDFTGLASARTISEQAWRPPITLSVPDQSCDCPGRVEVRGFRLLRRATICSGPRHFRRNLPRSTP
jgi:hypothetical protein